ncbi:hypothetical protein HZC00_00735 [Candidatus Kaiserbacteria bacterium]|nr:hypothetical protein [Candidatus Kaiserbacteria bacterium]
MLHRSSEAGIQTDASPKGKLTEGLREAFSSQFWMGAIMSVGMQLKESGHLHDCHLFSEGWTSPRDLERIRRFNHKLCEEFHGVDSFLAAMVFAGARMHITEGLSYQLACRINLDLRAPDKNVRSQRYPNYDGLVIHRRDRYVAERLNEKITRGEVAILCMGSSHDVPAYLDESWKIHVVSLPYIHDVTMIFNEGRVFRWMEIFRKQLADMPPDDEEEFEIE